MDNSIDSTTAGFSFRMDLGETRENQEEHANRLEVPRALCDAFREDGFVVIADALSAGDVEALNNRLEHVLRGRYDRSERPDKFPRILKSRFTDANNTPTNNNTAISSSSTTTTPPTTENDNDTNNNNNENNDGQSVSKQTKNKNKNKKNVNNDNNIGPIGFSGNIHNVKVLQIINIHKADACYRRLATNGPLGRIVAELAGWERGARLAQDQVWAKPPGAPPLTFHRDSPYFMFEPSDVVTVWVALDDMDEEIGPLEYVRGSHKWGSGRIGSANQFFQENGGLSLLRSAAEKEGISLTDSALLDRIVSMAGLRAGGISIHDGKTWHGSPRNNSRTKPRRGLGLHFVPAQARFTKEALHSRLWRRYVEFAKDDEEEKNDDGGDALDVPLPEEDFPVTWTPPKKNVHPG